MLSGDITENLRRFFAWVLTDNPANLGYPHITPERRLLGSMVSVAPLSDEEGEQMDRALCALREADGEGYALIVEVYANHRTLRWLEAKGKGERKRNGRVLSAAHNFLQGFLTGVAA